LIAAYRQDPRIETLAPDPGGRPRGLRMLDPAVEARITGALSEYVAQTPRPSLRSVVERVRAECRAAGLAPPERSAFTRRLAAIENAARGGDTTAVHGATSYYADVEGNGR
jgi:hypothetical protein